MPSGVRGDEPGASEHPLSRPSVRTRVLLPRCPLGRPTAPAALSVTRAARQLHETVSSLLSGCWGPPGTRVDPARQMVSAQPADRWTCPGVGRGGARMGLGPRGGEAVWLRRVGRLPEPRLLPVRSEGSRAEPVRGPRPRGQRPARCRRRAAQRACDLSAGAARAPCPLGSRPLPSGGCTCLIWRREGEGIGCVPRGGGAGRRWSGSHPQLGAELARMQRN